jgi:hypothetical protein
MKSVVLLLALCCSSAGCALDKAAAGDPCRRSLECTPGLACVQGECSRDLGPIAAESTVPELAGGADGAPLPDAVRPDAAEADSGAADATGTLDAG